MFSRRSSRRLSVLSAGLLFAVMFFLTATDGPQQLFAQGQTPQVGLLAGRNVNMVAGTTWPDGDPYLQRQNEPSIAGSTRNPLHMLAGANDYRSVDLPFVDGADETGDAWLGVFKSYDGGARWRTNLLPGYPQDTSDAGMASPLKGYQAGADPVVRAGTNGLLYYAGLVFDRTENGRSAVFVARYIDNNNQEDNYRNNKDHVPGDPITYLGAKLVATNGGTRFLDKPWIAVDVPRDGRTCSIPRPDGGTQRIPAGNVYIAYSSIYSDNQGLRSDIYLSRSLDCGATWLIPVRVSAASDRINQGATLAIDPVTGNIFISWRRFAAGTVGASQVDAVMSTVSTDRGGRFSAPGVTRAFERGRGRKVGINPERYFEHRSRGRIKPGNVKPGVTTPTPVDEDFDEFDQATSDINEFLMFRTNAYPTMAIDGTGRVYVAWTERGFVPGRPDESRVVISTSTNGRTWTAPAVAANESALGHQLMPSLTFGGGRLVLVYYDFREDTSGQFTRSIDDKRAIQNSGKRHTMDLRASVALAASLPAFQPSVRVSDYLLSYAQLPNGTLVQQQGQYNPPNLPMFKQGTAPFMGDYIDVAVSPAFVPAGNNRWVFNTNGSQPVFHAVWTDNRDVRQPKQSQDIDGDGNPWNNYTPPTVLGVPRGTQSRFDPTKQLEACDPQKTASRNQNIYTARLSMGLVTGSPGNAKPLDPKIQRAFVVFAQNTTSVTKSFRLTILNQPTGGRASFRQFDLDALGAMSAPLTQLVVTTPPKSTAARSVYATSSNPYAQIQVDVVEVPYNGSISPVPLADRIVLNPDIANPDIANPDIANPDIANPDIANAEVYNPDIANPDIANPDIANPDIANPDIANPDIANPDIANPDIANPDIANPDIANPDIANKTVSNPDIANPDIANPDIANPDIANPDIANPDIANPDIANPDIANSSLSDVTWTMTNDGNTTAAFNVNLFLAQQSSKICAAGQDPKTTGCVATQLILRKVYTTPVADGCAVALQSQNIVIANIRNPQFVFPGQALSDQNSSDATNATLWLAPGEKAQITLRVFDPNKLDNVPVNDTDGSTPTPGGSRIDPIFLPTTDSVLGSVTPVVQQQAVDTQDVQTAAAVPNAPPPAPPIVTPLSPKVPNDSNDPAPTPLALQFVSQPTAVYAGAPFSTSVQVFDQYGKVLPNAPVTLFVGTNPDPQTTPTLTGSTAFSDATGLASFPAVTISPAAVGYTLVATSGQALPAVSGLFDAASRPATVEFDIPSLTKTYTGATLAPTWTTNPAGLNVTLAFTPATHINAGTYSVTASINDPIYQGGATAPFIITKATPVITWAAPAAIAQGTLLGATQLNATANLPGSFVYTPAADTVMNTAGAQTLSVTFTPTDTLNYNSATATVSIDVNGAAPPSGTLYVFVPGTAGGTVSTWPNAGGTPPVNPGLYLNAGDAVTISASGAVSWYGAGAAPPGGAPSVGCNNSFIVPCPMPGISLIARIGGGPWQFVGAGPTTLTANTPGALEFAVNDNGFIDNGGGWDVTVTPLGPVSRWSADGTALDSVGGNHGTLQGGASYTVGRIGPGFNFYNPVGVLTPNQFVLVPDSPSLRTTGAMTMSAWIYPTGEGRGQDGQGGMIINKEWAYEMARFTGGSICWAFGNGVNSYFPDGYGWICPGGTAPLNAWTHVVVTYNHGIVTTFINGAQVDSRNLGSDGLGAGPYNLRIGGREFWQTAFFDGRIDEVGIQNRALTPAEVLALYNAAPPLLGAVWSASGSGTVTLLNNGSTGAPTFAYNNPGVFTGAWTMSTVAAASQTVNLSYAWSGFHSYFMVTTGLDVFVNRNGTDVFLLPLENVGPYVCCVTPSAGFSYAGATTVTVQAGDTYGFRLRGGHGDGTYAMNGTFNVVAGGTPSFAVNVLGSAGGALRDAYGAAKPTRVFAGTLAAGQQVSVTATGLIQRGAGFDPNGPEGIGVSCNAGCLAPSLPALAFVARVGTDPWQLVGAGPTVITATSAGFLEFGVNDDYFLDNAGAFVATVSWTAGPTSFLEAAITGDASILADGVLVSANNLGGSPSAVTVNGVPFGTNQVGLIGPWGPGGGDFSVEPFSQGLDAILSTLQFSGTLNPVSFEIGGLTPGQNYRLQLLFSNDVNTTGNRVNVTVQGTTWILDDWQPNAINLTAQFTATSPTAVVTFAPSAGSDGESGRAVLNGYVIHRMAP